MVYFVVKLAKAKKADLALQDTITGEIDKAIDVATQELLADVKEDRARATEMYLELLNLFNQGKNHPDDLRELNRAQELIQSTTEQIQKILGTLARIKVGDARIQIAQINAKGDETTDKPQTRAELIGILDNILQESQDNIIDVEAIPSEIKDNS